MADREGFEATPARGSKTAEKTSIFRQPAELCVPPLCTGIIP